MKQIRIHPFQRRADGVRDLAVPATARTLLICTLMCLALPAAARAPKRTPLPIFSVVVPFRAPSGAVPIPNPLSAATALQMERARESQSSMPRLENLPLPNGLSLALDRSLKVRLDLATLWLAQVRQPDTYALTLELQSGAGWLWLTWALPSAKEKQTRRALQSPARK